MGERQYSAALNCKHVLESKGSEGVKSEGKRAKRERERGINRRFWHVRELTEELSAFKCEPIPKWSESCRFSDIHHYYTCPELGFVQATLRRFPHNCLACDEVITQPWDHAIRDPVNQPRFKNPESCFFKPLFEDENEWRFVQLHEKKGTSKEEVDEENQLVFRNKTITVSRSIQVGNIGAYTWMDEGGRKKAEEKIIS